MAERSLPRTLLFRSLLLLLVLAFLEGLGYLCMWYNSRANDHFSNKNYFNIRYMLMGSTEPEHYPRYLSLPGVGYVPYPGYAQNGYVQHNRDGYRGAWVPVQKTDKYRILCLGGSTTYGSGVSNPAQTYPAYLQQMADSYIRTDSALSRIYKGAEVINAGVEAGTSADELRLYLFKFRYYRANLVIIHSGINDALLAAGEHPDFQLDYTHRQRMLFHLEPLAAPARCCMRSYFFSFVAIRLFYDGFTANPPKQHFVRWSNVNMERVAHENRLEDYPFYRNSETLYRQILADSARLLVLPNALNPGSPMVQSNKPYVYFTAFNDSLSKKLARQEHATYISFNLHTITNPESWLDDCHLDTLGEKDKAKALWPYVQAAMKK